MIIKGHIGRAPEKHVSPSSGRTYYVLRIAENYGRENERKAVWFDTVAAIPSLEAEMLAVGQVVSAEGRLEAQAYVKKKPLKGIPVPTTWEGVVKCLHEHNALAVGLKLFTQKVVPDHFEQAQKRKAAAGAPSEPGPQDTPSAEAPSAQKQETPPQESPTQSSEPSVSARKAPF